MSGRGLHRLNSVARWKGRMNRDADPRELLHEAHRTLIARTDGLGDNVLGSALPTALDAQLPGQCGFLSQSLSVSIVDCAGLAFVAGVDATPRSRADVVKAGRRLAIELRRFKPDVVILPRFDFEREALALALAAWRPATTIAWSRDAAATRVRRNLWLDAFPGPRLSGADAPAHEFERFQHLAAYLGIADTDTAPRVVIDDTALAGVEAQLDQRRPLAGLAIGAVHPKRQWPGERYGQVAAALLDSGVTPVLLGSPGEASIARDVTAALSSPDAVVDLVGKVAPRGIPALLRRCELFVGNDSGLGHIAAAVGTPTVTISCHPRGAPESHFNAPERYRPWITPGIVVRPAQAACAECQDGCVWHAPPCCIAAVPAADVIEACREVAAFVP